MYFLPPKIDLNRHLANVKRAKNPFEGKKFRAKGPQRAGLVYESEVKENLQERFRENCEVGSWFTYQTDRGNEEKFCQLDAFVKLEDQKRIIIVESKLKHTLDAYMQIELLYYPVLKKFFGPGYSYCGVEICRLYDPTTANAFPHRRITDILEATPPDFSVLQWMK